VLDLNTKMEVTEVSEEEKLTVKESVVMFNVGATRSL
jgi:hypothetical protein